MPKNSSKPLVRSPLIVYSMFPDESSEDTIKFSRLINALEKARDSHEAVLDLSFTTFGKLINSDHFSELVNSDRFSDCTAHIEIKYIRDFFFENDWSHLKTISFANQNLSCFEISIIMMSIIHDRRGSADAPIEMPIIKQLSSIDISGNDLFSETLDIFSVALVDIKRPEKNISGMLQLERLNLTCCNIKSDDENATTLRSLGVMVITDDENAGFVSALGVHETHF